ncbi:MAG: S24 family peptidase, partial [Desulfatirhabdiaceae bacterium]
MAEIEYPDRCFLKALKHFYGQGKFESQKDLALAADVAPSIVNELLKEKRAYGPSKQEKIAAAFGYDLIEFLVIGRSILETGQPPPEKTVTYPYTPEHPLIVQVNNLEDKERLNGFSEFYRGIPLYESGRLAAGVNGTEFDPNEEPSSTVIVYKPELKGCSNHRLLALRVGGDSMKPTVTQDSIVVTDLDNREYFDRKLYVVCLKEDGQMVAAVKRVRKWQNGFVLVSDNPD